MGRSTLAMNAPTEQTTVGSQSFNDSEQEHAVRYYVKNFDQEFPDRPPQELEEACQKAYNEMGQSGDRNKLEARARQILST